MASFYAASGVDMLDVNIGTYQFVTWTSATPTQAEGDYRSLGDQSYRVQIGGDGITLGPDGLPASGVVNRISELQGSALVADVRGFSVPGTEMADWVRTGDTRAAYSTLLAGHDGIQGSPEADVVKGFSGNDYINAGAGVDTAVFGGAASDFHFVTYAGTTAALPLTATAYNRDGLDKFVQVENVAFQNGAPDVYPTDVRPLASVTETFRPLDYIASYPDLINWLGTNANPAFDHYVYSGFFEGRRTEFSGAEYIASQPDLAYMGANGDAGAGHYIAHGIREGRTVSFHGNEYIASYPDLMAWLGADPNAGAQHYLQNGRAEGRTVTFDGLEYIASYADLSRTIGADANAGAEHYIEAGRAQGRQASFDGLQYIASYADLIGWLGANSDAGATHYIEHGRAEGRADSFDPVQYLNNYADLRTWLGNNQEAATVHFIQHGFAEGRTDNA
jgi:hypothetical protein